MTSGVYAIRNRLTGDTYIGSSHNIEKRWHVHQYRLNNNRKKHPRLQQCWSLYGAPLFEMVILEEASVELLKYREQRWILMGPQLNICYSAWGARKMSEEQRQAIVSFNRSRTHSLETRKKIGEANKGNTYCLGRVLSEETKQKIREASLRREARKREVELLS